MREPEGCSAPGAAPTAQPIRIMLAVLTTGVRAGPLLSSIPVDIRLFNATYDGRFKANDVQTFNNELVVRQTLQGAQTI
ncbi:MAG: hypothetical protein ACO33A_03525, partial [Hyphomonas sp.]